jgi:DNA-binding NtrC family response regulator
MIAAMGDRRARIVLVTISDSFGTTIEAIAEESALDIERWSPDGDQPLPGGAEAVLLLAGGEETAALDLLAELPTDGAAVYVIGSSTDHRVATALLKGGASEYFALPQDTDVVRRTLDRLARQETERQAADSFADAERGSVGFASVVGQSAAISRVVEQARRVARHDNVTILIEGETGTGKEVLARAIHYHGPRAAGPFVEVNCTAIPDNLLESELFGHERGSFTGAIAAKQGLFELAHGGTLLLDEIGHLPLELQAKLLRALESREIRRVGGNKTRAVDVRVLAATHVRLSQAVARGEFREDLFYRLNVVSLRVPPLREREGDIELLAERFVSDLATHHGLPLPALTPEVHSALRGHQWPGNVRELRNAIERALVLSPPGTLELDELWLEKDDRPVGEGAESLLPFPAPLESIIRAAVAAMVELTQGNKSEAARMLGISRPRLQRWLGEDADGPADQ